MVSALCKCVDTDMELACFLNLCLFAQEQCTIEMVWTLGWSKLISFIILWSVCTRSVHNWNYVDIEMEQAHFLHYIWVCLHKNCAWLKLFVENIEMEQAHFLHYTCVCLHKNCAQLKLIWPNPVAGPQWESGSVVDQRQPGEELWKQKWRRRTTAGTPSRGWLVTDRGGGASLPPYTSADVTGSE